MKKLFLILLTSLFFIQCKKEPELVPKSYTIKGNLWQDCSGIPLAHDTLIFTMSKWRWLQGTDSHTTELITDSRGNFSHSYPYQDFYTQASISVKNGRQLLEIKLNNTYQLTDFAVNASAKYRCQLIFDQPYVTGDTLYINRYRSKDTVIKIAAPFTDILLNHEYEITNYILPTYAKKDQLQGFFSYSLYGNTPSPKTYHESIALQIESCVFQNQVIAVSIP